MSIPAGNEGIKDAIGRGVPDQPTEEELAVPPVGEIRKLYLRDVNQIRSRLATVLGSVPVGPEGRQSSVFATLQKIKTGLDQLSSSRLEAELFGLIPSMAEVFDVEHEDGRAFVIDAVGWLQGISPALLHTVARHIETQDADVTAGNLAYFVKMFSTKYSFITLGDWEDEPMPVDSAGVMILDASRVVTLLKAGPWEQAKHFLSGADDPGTYFGRYGSTGDGLPLLKARYLGGKAVIDAKFVELRTWVKQQEAAAAPQ